MASLVLTGDTSGSGTITVPAVAGTFTATMGSATGTHFPFTAGTAVASTSGTSIDFTSIPSWVKRITVMFNDVSTSGTSNRLIQLGDSGGIENTNYKSYSCIMGVAAVAQGQNYTTGFGLGGIVASYVYGGAVSISLLGSNTWCASGMLFESTSALGVPVGGSKTLSDTLTQIRITTVNGTDTFDAGSINILYE